MILFLMSLFSKIVSYSFSIIFSDSSFFSISKISHNFLVKISLGCNVVDSLYLKPMGTFSPSSLK